MIASWCGVMSNSFQLKDKMEGKFFNADLTSVGFLVIGWSGKILIHTLLFLLVNPVIVLLTASIWRAVILPFSKAWRPKTPNWSLFDFNSNFVLFFVLPFIDDMI